MVGVIGYSSNLLPLRRKGKKEISIAWLFGKECLEGVLGRLESLIGKPRKEAWPVMREWVDECTETIRERDIILHALGDFYQFMTKDSFAFKYPIKGKAIPWIKSLPELRVEVFSRRFRYRHDEGVKAIKEILPGEGSSDLKESLWADYSHYEVLQRIREKPDLDQIIGLANFYSLVVLCRFSVELRADIEGGIPGSVAKAIVYAAKRNGVFIELDREDKGVVVRVLPGNRELGSVGQQNALSRVIGVLIRELLRNKVTFVFSTLVKHPQFKNLKRFSVDSGELREHSVASGIESITSDVFTADSEAERVLFEKIRKNAMGWAIHEDPEIVFLEKSIYVPDFVAEQEGRKVLIELAGFYTADYLEKKAEKLKEVEKKHDLVVLVPEENTHAFQKLSSPIISYRKKPSAQRLLRVLEHLFSQSISEEDLLERVGKALENWKSPLPICISVETLQQRVGVKGSTLQKAILSPPVKAFLEEQGYVIVSPVGMMKKHAWEKIGESFETIFEKGVVDLREYEKKIPKGVPADWIPVLLETHGFSITYEDFASLMVEKRKQGATGKQDSKNEGC